MGHKLSKALRGVTVAAMATLALATANDGVEAAENAAGIYLLGSKSSMAGYLPPPGTYGSSIKYYYDGSASANAAAGRALGQIGNVTLQADIDLDAKVFIDLPTLLRVTPYKVFGGNVAVGAILPIGWKDISADIDALAALTLANGTTIQQGARFNFSQDNFDIGDPLVTAIVGWHNGNWHWNVSGLLNVPVGPYSASSSTNIAFNHWAFDAAAAVTWLDATKGRELSAAAGFTFNGENDATNYETGTEFHVEFAAMQYFSKAFAIGITGYHYKQVTGDSGAGATLGSFKGEVTAIGPNINYNFNWGQTPVSTSLRWLHEFDATNRLEGDAVLFSAVIPFGVGRRAEVAAK